MQVAAVIRSRHHQREDTDDMIFIRGQKYLMDENISPLK